VSCSADCTDQRGSPCLRLRKRSVVTCQGSIRPWVYVDGADRTIGIQPRWVWAGPRLLSVEQVIERIEDLRSLIPEQVTGDG